ncbi:MAG TPA: ferritin-like domain-containing protein [Candidatus Thermoplasmatota archaeon]|nr:ferritin-like domain-containing protein [Candidatus Thermoplasmatota archaeon]
MPNVVDILKEAYSDEIETVANYLALSIAMDGVRAEEVKEKLEKDVPEELNHAKLIASRLKDLGHMPPGSLDLDFHQNHLQVPRESTDVMSVVRGVLEAEGEAIRTYRRLIEAASEDEDHVTEDLGIQILADEERHRTLFRGYLKELEQEAPAKPPAEAPARR